MARLLIILLVALVLEAVGVVFLSKGVKQVGGMPQVSVSAVAKLVGAGASNPNILFGVFLEAVFFGALLYLLAKSDVSFVWPLTSLGFVLTTLAARFLLHEHVTYVRWTGVILIMIGAGLITWTEHQKSGSEPQTAPARPPITGQ